MGHLEGNKERRSSPGRRKIQFFSSLAVTCHQKYFFAVPRTFLTTLFCVCITDLNRTGSKIGVDRFGRKRIFISKKTAAVVPDQLPQMDRRASFARMKYSFQSFFNLREMFKFGITFIRVSD